MVTARELAEKLNVTAKDLLGLLIQKGVMVTTNQSLPHELAEEICADLEIEAMVASAGEDNTLRLWPMPDLSKPPLHTLPHDELIAKLHSLTNIRVVRDEESSTGWNVKVGPFPGWAEVPTW